MIESDIGKNRGPSDSSVAAMQTAAAKLQGECNRNEHDSSHYRMSPNHNFIVNPEFLDTNREFMAVYCRTDSWNRHGETTELHEVLSVFFAVFLRCLARLRAS